MDRGGWWATIHGVVESGTTEQLMRGIQLHFQMLYFIFFKFYLLIFNQWKIDLQFFVGFCWTTT